MKTFNYSKGQKGELIAKDYLQTKGFIFIQSNFHTRFGEIDLIMVNNSTLVFIEVKLKTTTEFGIPEDMINRHKIHQLETTAQSFLKLHPNLVKLYQSYRFDAVCIVLNQDSSIDRLTHYPNITF